MLQLGIDQIKKETNVLGNKRLGLITSASGYGSSLKSTAALLHESYELTALFGPEHGVRGDREAGEMVDSYLDEETGLTVYSLYRKESKRFTKEMLDHVDAVVYDIQDLGVRYYTFISTLLYALEDCAKFNKQLIVLDRPNPLSGETVEGSVLETEYKSFVGAYPLATRYGLTAGELAVMVNKKEKIGCDLHVICAKGWKRKTLFPEYGRVWIMPSLGIPRFDSALLYPGTCLVEGTNLSEGRGTSCPFELIGAPFIKAEKLTKVLTEKHLPGIVFTPAYFTPTASKHKGSFCQGVHLHITDYHGFESYVTGVTILEAVRDLYPKEFALQSPLESSKKPFIQLLDGTDSFADANFNTQAIIEKNYNALSEYRRRKEAYHMYD